jgi:tetratricopeptide (TPR) repeat protein
MKKQRKPPPLPKPSAAASIKSVEDIAGAARRDLEAGRFREAINRYKDLLKQGDAPDWRRGLADAYAGRAGELTEKGMLKEALVIWDNRRQLGEAASPSPAHADLLLRLGQTAAATALYRQAQPLADEAALAALGTKLAAHFLAGDPMIAEGLAPDDPILVHGTAARAALAAYSAGDAEALAASLAGIPFRSPYRDWAQILKALQRLPEQPEAAKTLLARVADGSAFANLRRAAELALVPEADLAARITGAGEAVARFALTLRGWGEERQAMWQEAERVGSSPQRLLRLMYRHRARLGEDWVRQGALRLVLMGLPRSLSWLQEAGAKRPTPAEGALMEGWQADQGRHPGAVVRAWHHYADILGMEAEPLPGSDAALRLALVQRHADRWALILQSAGASGEADELDQVVAATVGRSLIHDPDDTDTYLRLGTYYRQVKDYKEARHFLGAALTRWPEDLRVLTAALDLALATNAFKRGTGLARSILDLDPINTGARERLVKAHIAHARKQIRARRTDLAMKELDQAREWGGEAARERIDLTATFVNVADARHQDVAAGVLRDQAERLGGGLRASVALGMEAVAVGQPLTLVLRQAGLAKAKHGGREDLLACLARLRTHLDGGERLARDLGASLQGQLKAAASLDLSAQEAEGVCETLRRADLDEARLAFATAALRRWRGAPRFEFHAFEARYRGARWAKDNDLDRVVKALERAQEEGDNRTVHRLEELLRDFGSPFASFSDDFDDLDDLEDFEDPDDLDTFGDDFDPIRIVVANLVQSMGLDGLFNMLGLDPKLKRQFQEIKRELGTDGLVDALKVLIGEKLNGLGLPTLPRPPRTPKPPKPSKPKKKTRGSDEDPPDQMDLF